MFNSKRFVDGVLCEAWTARIAEAKRMRSSASHSYVQLLEILVSQKQSERENFFRNLQSLLWILDRKLPWSFGVLRMNQGKEMTFHPVTGDSIITLKLMTERKLVHYAADTTGGEWGSGRKAYSAMENVSGEIFLRGEVRLPLIGTRPSTPYELNFPYLCGCPYYAGSPYLPHWKYCPWTGEELKKGDEVNENPVQ